MAKMIEISAAEYERLQDCIREDGMRIAALIEENKALHQDAKRLTAVDAVQVVRCKDCRFAEFGCCADGFVYCNQHQSVFPDNGFCYMGFKKAALNGGKRNEAVQGF